MAQPLRYESPDEIFLLTTRTIGSRLWFVNNPELEEKILGYLAKYQTIYEVDLYAFRLMGNHYHLIARFPKCNKAAFMRAFNAIIAKLVSSKVPGFTDGKLWARRYADQAIRGEDAVMHWFFYVVLNPVISGVAETIREFEGFNSFYYAASGSVTLHKVFNRGAYNEAKRWGAAVNKKDYIENYRLKFSRLPGYESNSQKEYQLMLGNQLEERRVRVIDERRRQGLGFASRETRKCTQPGAKPKFTKKSDRYSFRPLVLTLSKRLRKEFLEFYFDLTNRFREASDRYLRGEPLVEFPFGTYSPPMLIH
jgi:REP element-mobilizing transposase RayT